ncbi:hypothetical protein [Mesorhizobium sp. B2-2-4]|uniref:hypothetical protein n=1 Tax=Mesorhizobium sp. B2-2-4 TaxID=2589962 RepID=UPI0015E45630|nr:hypothetical protein [Mesorhizobium sp. B2-2-4]
MDMVDKRDERIAALEAQVDVLIYAMTTMNAIIQEIDSDFTNRVVRANREAKIRGMV